MTFRFRKSIRIVPGVRVNLSKTGTSVSVGRPGATMNYNGKRTRATVGLPGTGLSYSEDAKAGAKGSGGMWATAILLVILNIVVSVIFPKPRRRR